MLYSSNALVEMGMWGLRRWKGAQCITELSLKDVDEPTATLLYRLSTQPSLGAFRNVLLVSSSQDRYVPYHSTRIQLCEEAVHDARYGAIFVSMVHHLLAPNLLRSCPRVCLPPVARSQRISYSQRMATSASVISAPQLLS